MKVTVYGLGADETVTANLYKNNRLYKKMNAFNLITSGTLQKDSCTHNNVSHLPTILTLFLHRLHIIWNTNIPNRMWCILLVPFLIDEPLL